MADSGGHAGRYQLVDELPTPLGGLRYRALGLHLGPKRLLVFRHLEPEDPRDLAAFRTLFFEGCALGRDLQHPNLSPVVDFGEEGAGCFQVLEGMAGHTLDVVLDALSQRGMRLPASSAAYIAHQICSGLSFAHSLTDRGGRPLNPVHLTLDPASVLIGYDGGVRVLDGGLVPAARLTPSGAGTWGRVAYFSPERVKGEELDARSDVYAAGLILHEALTQRPLFRRASREESMADILSGEVPGPSELGAEVSLAFDRVVEQALARRPDQRFSSAWELEEALRDLVGGVELRRSRSTLSGMMNTIFAEQREDELQRVREAIAVIEDGGGFTAEAAPSAPEDFEGADSGVTPLPIGGFALAAARQRLAEEERAEAEADAVVGGASGRVSRVPRHELAEAGEAPAPDLYDLETIPPLDDEDELEAAPPAAAPPPPTPRPATPTPLPRAAPRVAARAPAPPPLRPWRLVLGTAAVLTLGLVALMTSGEGRHAEVEAPRVDVDAAAAVIAALHARHPDARDLDGGKAKLGWQGLLEGTTSGDEAALLALEEAVAADPSNLPAVAGLAVAYARRGRDDAQRGVEAAELLSRAQALGRDDVYTLRAEAGVALGAGNDARGLEAARRCRERHEVDGICAWFEGLALVGLGRVSESLAPLEVAAERLSGSPGLALALGRASLAGGDFKRAMEVLSSAAERFGRHADLQAELARLLYLTGQHDEALARAERAVEVDGGHLSARLLRGELLLHVKGSVQQAALALAELAREPALERHPERRRALVQASIATLLAGDRAEALAFAERAVALAPGDGPAQLALALALSAGGDADGAGAALLAADLGGLPAREVARFRLHAARVFMAHGRERFARQELEEALEAAPGWTPATLTLAGLLLATGDTPGAFRTIEGLALQDLHAEGGRDPLLQAPPVRPETEPLRRELEQRILASISPEPALLRAHGALLALDCALGEDRRCREAEQRLTGALDDDPTDAASRVMLARVQLARGNHDAAVATLTRLIEGRGASPEAWALLAEAREALGRQGEADAAFAEAHSLAPEAAGLYRRHAVLLDARGDAEGARARAARARALDPSDLIAAGILLR